MSAELYLAYLTVCAVAVVVPGPTATLIVANGLAHGTRAGLLNVLGTQIGLAIMIAVAGIGLTSLVELMGHWLDWIRLVGAACLVWLGVRMIRSAGAAAPAVRVPRGGFVAQGCLLALSNPKMLLFFGALLPQFIDPAAPVAPQIVALGLTAMAVALLSDGSYAVLSGRAGRALSGRQARLLWRLGGGLLVGGGLWLALSRRS